MSRLGFKFAMYEHRWEIRANYVILVGIIVASIVYYFKIDYEIYGYPFSSAEVGLFFLFFIGIVHLCARISHKGEQILLKDSRPWRKKK